MTILKETPLPGLDSPRVLCLKQPILDAYSVSLQAEKQTIDREKTILARIVGYFLLELSERSNILTSEPSTVLATWTTTTGNINVVYELGTLLRDKFIRAFRTSSNQYPPPSSHPSQPSFDTDEDMISDTLEATKKDHRVARRKALARDGERCMVAGVINMTSTIRFPELLEEADRVGSDVVETAHILNESTMQGIDPEGVRKGTASESTTNKTRSTATTLTILETFGYKRFTEAFRKSGGVHEISNILSLCIGLHRKFDALEIWFESTEEAHKYEVCSHRPAALLLYKRNPSTSSLIVKFTSRVEGSPLPDPCLLALHAACARVVHMSGAAEYFDRLERDTEETDVLASDGSSATLLSGLLSPFATFQVPSHLSVGA